MNCPYLSSKHCNFMSRHTTCRGRPIWENPTYSAFWSVFGATCPRLQRLASSVGFWTTARLTPRKNLPDSDVSSEPGGCYAAHHPVGMTENRSQRFNAGIVANSCKVPKGRLRTGTPAVPSGLILRAVHTQR